MVKEHRGFVSFLRFLVFFFSFLPVSKPIKYSIPSSSAHGRKDAWIMKHFLRRFQFLLRFDVDFRDQKKRTQQKKKTGTNPSNSDEELTTILVLDWS